MATLLVHYSEIALKGENRNFFEKLLVSNLRKALGKNAGRVYRRYGRIVCDLNNEDIKLIMEKVPGVASFSFAVRTGLDIEEMKKASLDALKNREFLTFGVAAKRSNKQFKKTSKQINEILGKHIIEKLGKNVDLDDPDARLYVEVCEKEAFVYCKKHPGIGGLPVGASSKLLCSLSGGIDSPVASYLMMKRGCKIVFVHIYNKTQVNEGLLSKIKSIVKQLTGFQLHSKLYIVPFEKIQKEIIMNVQSQLRMIIYRRFMLRIINHIAKKERIKGIVTGDSIGQVASQTVENLRCIHDASELPVFSPLIGMNKDETIKIARKIGTYELSTIPYPDCCSFMIAKHPATRAELNKIIEAENKIKNQEELIRESVEKANVISQALVS